MKKIEYTLNKGYILVDAKKDSLTSLFRIEQGRFKGLHFLVKNFYTVKHGDDELVQYEYLVFDDSGEFRKPYAKEKKVIEKCLDNFIDIMIESLTNKET